MDDPATDERDLRCEADDVDTSAHAQNQRALFSSHSRRRLMGSEGDDKRDGLALPMLVPAPTPPLASDARSSKSKLKPPTQRTLLLPGVKAGTSATSGSSPLKLPMLGKPAPPASRAPPAVEKRGNQDEDDRATDAVSRVLLSSAASAEQQPRGVGDKNRDFLKELAEQKKKQKEDQARQELRRRKLQKKLTQKILQEAAQARQKQQEEDEVPEEAGAAQPEEVDREETVEQQEEDEEAKRRQKDKAKRQKRLLKKQQALLEQLQAKKREKQEEEEQEKERDRRRQEKLKKAVLDAIHAKADEVEEEDEHEAGSDEEDASPEVPEEEPVDAFPESVAPVVNVDEDALEEVVVEQKAALKKKDRQKKSKHSHKSKTRASDDVATSGPSEASTIPAGKALAAIRQRKGSAPGGPAAEMAAAAAAAAAVVAEETPEDKQRAKEQRDAINRKQQEYLQKLAEQRRQKQKGEEDARALQEKRKKRVQLEAQQRLQEAAAKLQQQRLEEEEKAEEDDSADSKKAAPVDVDAMVARLSRLKDKDAQVVPEARDFASWKKRHGVRVDQKVFCMTGWYPVIREELEKRGWFFNQERQSPFFDLKWSLKSDDLKGFKLEPDQYVNHFCQNTAITTKVGLLHNLRLLPWHRSVDVDAIFPRAYDLNEPRDMDAFTMDFRYSFAEGVLKHVARQVLRCTGTPGSNNSVTPLPRLNEAFVIVLMSIASKKLCSCRAQDALEESVDDALSVGVDELVTDLEWEVLTKCQLDAPGKLRASLAYTKKSYADDRPDAGALPGDADTRGNAMAAPVAAGLDTVLSAQEKKQLRQLDKLRADAFARDKARLAELLAKVSELTRATADELVRVTRALEAASPQFHLNGGGALTGGSAADDERVRSRNVWIVKPAGMSRGRGIRVFNDLARLLAYADVAHHQECQWVAQKYIENPLLVCRRKFDIRQWVLVTSWDPLTVWCCEDFYLRFSSEEYSTDDLSDPFVHLTNNSIQKTSDKFHDVYATEDGAMTVEGNMWHSDDFRAYLRKARGTSDAQFSGQLHARMKEIIVLSLQCVQDAVQHRKNSCELYGYDFMLDEALRPWLIEVNSSPACDYSTPTAQRYVETGLAGIVKIIVDHREFEQKKKGSGDEPPPDTGRWRRIHRGEFIGKPVSSFGADFQVKGVKVQKTRGSKAAKATAAAVTSANATIVTDATSATALAIAEDLDADVEEEADDDDGDEGDADDRERERTSGEPLEEELHDDDGDDADSEGATQHAPADADEDESVDSLL